MTELPSGIDNPTMKEVIAWKMVEIAITTTPSFVHNNSLENKIEIMTKLYKQAYEVVFHPTK